LLERTSYMSNQPLLVFRFSILASAASGNEVYC